MMRYTYLGDSLTAPEYRGMQCQRENGDGAGRRWDGSILFYGGAGDCEREGSVMMYLPMVTEWFFVRRADDVYDVIVNDLMTICPACEVGNAFYILAGDIDDDEA